MELIYREKDPEQREEEFSTPLRVACENYRYSLVSTRTLFELVKRTLAGVDEAQMLAFRRRLIQGAGLLTQETFLGEAPEESASTGPIF